MNPTQLAVKIDEVKKKNYKSALNQQEECTLKSVSTADNIDNILFRLITA